MQLLQARLGAMEQRRHLEAAEDEAREALRADLEVRRKPLRPMATILTA